MNLKSMGNWEQADVEYMYRLKDGPTTRISTGPNANYLFPPRGEDAEVINHLT